MPNESPVATMVALASVLDGEAFEVACEDARRRRLTSVTALLTYLQRFGKRGMPGITATRRLLDALDPQHPSKSTLEVKTRRLLVAHGITDFAFRERRVTLETKRSIPGRVGYRLVFATWAKVTQHPSDLLDELTTTLAA